MRWPDQWQRWFTVPALNRGRIAFAFTVAVATDGLQLLLGPLGWFMADEILDLLAMGLTCWALGFHPLLLPTFIIELVPIADMLPTWTGCTAAVVLLRKRAARNQPGSAETQPAPGSTHPIIDISEPPAEKPSDKTAADKP